MIISSGSGVEMQSTSYLSPGYYRCIDQNIGGNGSLWQVLSNGTSCKIGRVYNVVPEPSGSDPFLAYNKELLKQIMLKHEAIFRNQVHELHRLYGRQRELMNDISSNQTMIQASQPKLVPSQMQCHIAQNALQIPRLLLDVEPIAEGGENFQIPSTSDSVKNARAGSRIYLEENALEEQRVPPYKSHYLGKKVFDLELPADHYVDSEDEEGLEDGNSIQVPQFQEDPSKTASQSPTKSGLNLNEASSPNGSLNYSKTKFLFDLNEPIQLDESETPISAHFIDSSTEMVLPDEDSFRKSKSESPARNEESAYNVLEGKGNERSSLISGSQDSPAEGSQIVCVDGTSLVSEVPEKDNEILDDKNRSTLSSCLTNSRSPVVISNEAKTEASISVSSHRISLDIVQALPCFNNPKFLSKGSRSSTPSFGNKKKYCSSKKNPARSASLGSVSCCITSNCDIRHAAEDGFLTECIKDSNHTKSADKNLDAPVSQENKEHTPRKGESEGNQIEIQKTIDLNENLDKVAAEAIVSISSLGIQHCLKNYDKSEILEVSSDCLSWFAGLVSSVTCDSKIEFETLSNDASSSDLKLTRIKIEDQCPETPNQKSKTRHRKEKGLTRKTRQRKCSSSLPSADVTENLGQTEQLITAAGRRTSVSIKGQKNVGRNGCLRRSKSLKKVCSNERERKVCSVWKQHTCENELSFTLSSLLGWGKKHRRQKSRHARGNYCFHFD